MRSFRSLLGQPVYVMLSLATLTLAVGANLLVFTIVNAAVGTVAGLIGAFWLGKTAESFLMGVSWFDPVSYATASLVMLASAGVAGFAAARRVKRIAPCEALRAE